IVICSMTGLVIVITGMHTARVPTQITLGAGDITYTAMAEDGRYVGTAAPPEIGFENGRHVGAGTGDALVSWHEAVVDELFVDAAMTRPFSGVVYPARGQAVAEDGEAYSALHGMAVESGAPLTMEAFRRGLAPVGDWGHYIVLVGVLLFGISTAISWSYYGDRCAHYLFGSRAVLPYKLLYVIMHFLGTAVPLGVAWAIGDVALAIVIWPNLIALLILAPKVVEMTDSYFERKPWEENARVHEEWKRSRGGA
ncbi:MAG TPA: alanine:cation symporter family protein, partial [Longimicrobiales bacterium]|nr:alanine:cation symporter family protein [Longimicrobiales bacterium]